MAKTQLTRMAYRESELPDLLGIAESTVAKLIRSNQIPSAKIGGSVVISVETLRDLIAPSGGDVTEQVSA